MPVLPLAQQESYRRRYAEEHPGWRPATHVYRDRVAACLGPSGRVLDLGCGRGGILEELHPRAGWAVGIDPDWASLAGHRLPSLPRAAARAESLPFPRASFDVVCCSWVLEHLPEPERALREVARVLAPGGHFIFVTPNAAHPLIRLNRLLHPTHGRAVRLLYGRAEEDTFPALYRANTVPQLEALLRTAGLEVVALTPIGDPTYLAFGELFYRIAVALERFIPTGAKIHIAGHARKG